MRRLYVKQKVLKVTDHYPILDERDEIAYYVDQDFSFFGHVVHLSDAEKNPIFTMKKEIVSFFPVFHVHFEDGKTMDIHFRLSFLRKKIDLESKDLNLRVEGDYLSKEFRIVERGTSRELAVLSRKLIAWGDTFEIEILDERVEAAAVAILIAVDHIIDLEQSN